MHSQAKSSHEPNNFNYQFNFLESEESDASQYEINLGYITPCILTCSQQVL